MWEYNNSNELIHHGVKGQRWGFRRFQNRDGTLTAAGKKRYNKEKEAAEKKAEQEEKARKQEHDYAIADRLYEEHARPSIRACNRAYDNYKAGKREDAMKDLEEAGDHVKKIEEGAKKAYDADRILKSDLYLEPKWQYESVWEDVYGKPSEFIEKASRRVKHSDCGTFDDHLVHWGIKGQKWGIRRYQNKDGTLTPAGKKRYAQEMAKLKKEEKILKNKQRTQAQLDKLDAKRKEIDAMKKGKPLPKEPSKSKKTLKDMSDDELRTVVNRLQMEKQYRELTPAKVSKGKRFASAVIKNVVAPAATEVSKQVLKDAMTKAVKNASAEKKK